VSVRAIAVRGGPRGLRRGGALRERFADDRRLIGLKLVLLGLLALAAMALEVPL